MTGSGWIPLSSTLLNIALNPLDFSAPRKDSNVLDESSSLSLNAIALTDVSVGATVMYCFANSKSSSLDQRAFTRLMAED